MKFSMWSLLHILFILSPFILTGILYVLTKNKTKTQKYKIGVWLSMAAVLILLFRNIEIFVKDGYKLSHELIPLQICHFANFVLLLAFYKKNDQLFALSFCLNLPAAFLSILYANSLENYQTIINFRGAAYIFGHMLIVGLVLWSWISGLIKINKTVFKKTIAMMIVLYVVAHIINNMFSLVSLNANYFYTLSPEKGTPLELFFEMGKTFEFGFFKINIIYLLMTMVFGLVVVSIFYGLYKIFNQLLFKPRKPHQIKELIHN